MAELRAAPPVDDAVPFAGDTLALALLPHQVRITVRGRASDATLVDAVAGVLGARPPTTPNTVISAGARTALWLAPATWRIVGAPDDDAATLVDALLRAVPRDRAGVVDVSDAYATIRMAGRQARFGLTHACPLDLHPDVFGPGQCAQSLIARIDVLLHHRADAPSTYDIEVRRSLATHLWSRLHGAPLESSGLLRSDHNSL